MDINKYKSIAVSHDTYKKIADLQKTIAPLSRSKMVSHLVEKVWQEHHENGTLKLYEEPKLEVNHFAAPPKEKRKNQFLVWLHSFQNNKID